MNRDYQDSMKELVNELRVKSSFKEIINKRNEFDLDIDRTVEKIKAHIQIEVTQLQAQIQGRLLRFPDRAKAMFDEYETELENDYKKLKFVFSPKLFDENGELIKDKLYNELQMVYSYPNADLDDFMKKGIHQLATIAKIELLRNLKAEPKKVENVEPEKSEFEIKFEQHFERLFKGIDQSPINRIVDFELTNLKNGFKEYFIEGKKPVSKVVFSKPNVKAICYHLGQLFEAMNNSKKVTPEYHEFCVDLIPFLNETSFEKFAKYSIEKTNF